MLLNALNGFGASAQAAEVVTDGLVLHLDAGDASSWDDGVDSQRWRDLAGSGYDFFLGADGSASSDDPSFNGTVGNKSASEYFAIESGDFFTYDSANESWMNDLHKNNAAFTLEVWLYASSSGDKQLFGSGATGNEPGILWWIQNAVARLYVFNNSGVALNQTASGDSTPNNQWFQLALTMDEAAGAGGLKWYRNGASADSSDDATITSPSTDNSPNTIKMHQRPSGATSPNGTRQAIFRAYTRALTAAEINQNWEANRHRFGL